jgi:hypothetical protein
VASPAVVSERNISQAPNHLYCPACGHEWLEADAVKVVQAWWSRGAYDGETREHAWAEIEWRIIGSQGNAPVATRCSASRATLSSAWYRLQRDHGGRVTKDEQARAIVVAAIAYVEARGPCDEIDDVFDTYCDLPTCSYCALARAMEGYDVEG